MSLLEVLRKCVLLTSFSFSGLLNALPARAIDTFEVTDLPSGKDVTIPGNYIIKIPNGTESTLTGMNGAQAITIENPNSYAVLVKIYAHHEERIRTLHIGARTKKIYNMVNQKPVRVRTLNGSVHVQSLHPIKIQR